MVVRRLRTRPALITRNASDSAAWVLKEHGKSLSVSSLRSEGAAAVQRGNSDHKRSSNSPVCFAQHEALCEYAPLTPEPLTEVECKRCFYTVRSLLRPGVTDCHSRHATHTRVCGGDTEPPCTQKFSLSLTSNS